jgi:hypothetical protein
MSELEIIVTVIVGLLAIAGYIWYPVKLLYKKVKQPFTLLDGDLVRSSTYSMTNQPSWPNGTCLYEFHLRYQGDQNIEVEKLQLEWRAKKQNSRWTEGAGGFLKKADSLWHTPMKIAKDDVIPAVVPLLLPRQLPQPADCEHFGISFKTNKSSERTFIPLSETAWKQFNCEDFRKLFKGA